MGQFPDHCPRNEDFPEQSWKYTGLGNENKVLDRGSVRNNEHQ
jgi:hypothetical protein